MGWPGGGTAPGGGATLWGGTAPGGGTASGSSRGSASAADGVAGPEASEDREAAAMDAGVGTRTLYRWLNDAECENFQIELKERQSKAIAHASIRLTGGIDTVASYLLEVIQDVDAPPSVRVRAALGWLDRQIRFVELSDLIVRIDALEAVANVNN